MDSPDVSPCNSLADSSDTRNTVEYTRSPDDEYAELQQQVIANFQKPNLPNVNVPEHIIICLDICYDDQNSLYRLGDGSSFTSINMLKRVLEFFLHSKMAINPRTEFALVIMKDSEACWVQDFTNSLKHILSALDFVSAEPSASEHFDFSKIFQILKLKANVPRHKEGECILPPSHVVRMLVLYNRSNCLPLITQDSNFEFFKKQLYFYVDILLAHEEDCALYKCEEIYDALQDLDNGYSYVFEVSKNATKIHDCIAKLLAHPLQRPLQKNAEYSFGSRI